MSLLALCVSVASPVRVHGQLLNFESYSHRAGLPQNQVRALIQDERGYIWIGTFGGLARFDGTSFVNLTTQDGLTSNAVSDLALDSTHALVAATVGGGVCFVRPSRTHCIEVKDGLASNNVSSVAVAPDGTVWAATDGGLSLLRDEHVVRTYGTADGLPSAEVSRVVLERDSSVWVGTAGGPAHLDGDRFAPDRAGVQAHGTASLLGATSRGIVLAVGDGVFLSNDGHVTRLAADSLASSEPPTDATEGRDGTLWISTRAGVLHYAGGTRTWLTHESGLLSDNVNRVIVDTEGDVWFGTEYGLSELEPGPFEFFGAESGLPNPFVRALLQDRRGRLWVGTRSGPALWDGRRFRPVALPLPARGIGVDAFANAPGGGVLVATRGSGLAWVRSSGVRVFGTRDGLPDMRVHSLVADSGGVWIGTQSGLARWSRGRISRPADSTLAHAFIVSMAEDRSGRLWLGLITGGVLVWDGTTTIHLGKERGLTDQAVWALTLAPDGAMWVGTNGEGAFRVQGDSITRLTATSGLANDFVWEVLTDTRGFTWFFTSDGLDRLRDGRIRHYGVGDGLVNQEGSVSASLEDAQGDLWFGTGSGVYRYDPSEDAVVRASPPVYLDDLRAGDRTFPLSGAVLAPQHPGLEVTFSSPTYRDRSAIRFRYRLGSEAAWSPPQKEPRVSLAGLGPGKYTFQVMAEDAAGQRSHPPASLTFSVRPEFWETWWFRGLMLLLVAIAIGSVSWMRARRLRSEHEALNQLVAERTRDLAEKTAGLEREIAGREAAEAGRLRLEEQLHQAQKMEAIGRLAGGIAHDFNNLLTAVIGHAQLLEQDLGEEHPGRSAVQEIEGAAQRGASLVSQLLAYSRQQIIRHDLVDLNETVEASARLLQRVIGDDVVLEVKRSEEPAPVRFDRTQLDQLLVNLAVNAKDAMPAGGRLTFEVGREELAESSGDLGPDDVEAGSYVTLEVRDVGMGMEEGVLERAFEPFFTTKETGRGTGLGLATVYGAVHQSGGFVQVRSVLGEGTSFLLYFPYADS